MSRRVVTVLLVLAFGCLPLVLRAGDGPVDRSTVQAGAPAGPLTIVVRQFRTERTDFGTGSKPGKEKYQEVAESMRASAPITLAQALVSRLQSSGVFATVTLAEGKDAPAGALVLDGDFTVLNPGSRGKRFWVGMGAGRSRVCVDGAVLGPDGKHLVDFGHCRSGTGSWSFVGGRSEGMMFNDLAGSAEKIAVYVVQWARGGAAK